MDDSKVLSDNYDHLLNDVRLILDRGLSKAYKAVDNLKVQTYLADWGKDCQGRTEV